MSNYILEETRSVQEEAVALLLEKGMTVATAESCTGGLIGKKITDVSGASECFPGGFVTYANEAKEQLLGVPHNILEEFGAVSPETALCMSKGARERMGTDIGIGITGIAGPTGGTDKKPVGLVYISICAKDFHHAFKFIFDGDREMVRQTASDKALHIICQYVLGSLDEHYI